MSACSTINAAWMLSCRPELRRFERATRDVESAQRVLLDQIMTANQDTAFGREFGFRSCTSYEQFAQRVPLSTYEGLSPYVDRIAAGQDQVLTASRVELLQPTSGSTGGRKLIPYTAEGQRLMQRTISAWIGDLFSGRPRVRRGRAYWSISPAFGTEERTSGGLRVGFADDTEYLGRFEQRAVRRVLAVPPEVAELSNISEFRQQTLAHMLAADDLSLISIWSPTFLSALMDEFFGDLDQTLGLLVSLDSVRASVVRSILGSSASKSEQLQMIWPDLALISCWTDGSAASFVRAVRDMFPWVELQPKGLLATEAFITFPLLDTHGAALAIRSHVFEFLPELGGADLLLGNALEVGARYTPVVTTGSGLYRYRMDDVVEVVGFEGTCPLLRFVGRNSWSDLVGEKLDEIFVADSLGSVLGEAYLRSNHAMLVPDQSETPHYCLVVDSHPADQDEMALAIDQALRSNPHYDYARNLNQLGEVRVQIRQSDDTPVYESYEQAMVRRGVRAGDIKPTNLVIEPSMAQEMLA